MYLVSREAYLDNHFSKNSLYCTSVEIILIICWESCNVSNAFGLSDRSRRKDVSKYSLTNHVLAAMLGCSAFKKKDSLSWIKSKNVMLIRKPNIWSYVSISAVFLDLEYYYDAAIRRACVSNICLGALRFDFAGSLLNFKIERWEKTINNRQLLKVVLWCWEDSRSFF